MLFVDGAIRNKVRLAWLLMVIVTVMATGSAARGQEVQLHPSSSGIRYDGAGRVVGEIQPDPDGSGPLGFPAKRIVFDPVGMVVRTEVGVLVNWQPPSIPPGSWPDFTIQKTERFYYDTLSQLVKTEIVGSNGIIEGVTQKSYDRNGRLVCTAIRMNPAVYGALPASACTLGVQGGQGPDRITKLTYDAAGQVIKRTVALGTADQADDESRSYTPNGKLATITDGESNRTTYEYDAFDRLVKTRFPVPTKGALASSTTDYEQYGYDANGNRTSLRKRDGSVFSYQYDALNRMTVKVVPERAGLDATHTRDVYYGYDLRGLQLYARFDGPGGPGLTSTYDGFGRMTGSTKVLDGAWALGSGYDANGNRTSLTYADGAQVATSYDQLNRPTAIWRSGSYIEVYSYNNAGQREWRDNTNGMRTGYSYDPVGRLKELYNNFYNNPVQGALNNLYSFAYNPASQVTARWMANTQFAWTGHYNVNRSYTANGLNQYTNAGTASFSYDANGNLISDGSTTFTYDAENRLVSASGAKNVTLRYDPLGRLHEMSGPSGTIRFVQDGDALVMEYDAAGNLLRRYVHGADLKADDPIAWYEGAAMSSAAERFLRSDYQGSIVTVSTASDMLAVNRYDEYGIPQSGNAGRFQYTGQAWLPDLGMYYYKARMYSPTLGRFMQTDPIGYDDGINWYAYVGNDPVNRSDPDGKQAAAAAPLLCAGPQAAGCAVGAAVVTAASACAASDACRGAVVSAAQAIGNGIRNLVAPRGAERSHSRADGATIDSRRQETYSVRVQAQGTALSREGSVPLSGTAPIPASAVQGALAGTQGQLTKPDQAALGPAFAKASLWIDRVAAGGGIGPIGSRSFTVPGATGTQMRVDIEILRGPINIVE